MNKRIRTVLGLLGAVLALAVVTLPVRAADTVVYYHTDALHSVSVVTDAQGQVIERTRYAPYGQVLNRPLRDGPGYTGHREDAATGLVYMQQRYYDPESGRFLSVDPVPVSAGGVNRYAYANANPYRYVDPDGRANATADEKGTKIRACTGSRVTCPSATRISQISAPGAPTSKIAHDMVSNNVADRVSAAHAAMDYFGIKPAAGTVDIDYDANLSPSLYAYTVYDTSQVGHGIVTLGPRAYISWAHLGSTLGHEIA